jgi:glycosyltransferase involved in cell wall biosynthesis
LIDLIIDGNTEMLDRIRSFEKRRIAYLSTFPPRECGIANYTKDLINALDELREYKRSVVIAINDVGGKHHYDNRVKIEIEEGSKDDYLQASQYINKQKIDLVNIQHEFGIFGGDWGDSLVPFLENLDKPVVITLHTILSNFKSKPKSLLKTIANLSSKLLVMTNTALELLEKYGLDTKKIVTIPHGAPNIPFGISEKIKNSLKLNKRIVLSTFGLISRGKGIQNVIRALPQIVKKEPRVLYLIIGETHPEVRKRKGERYRRMLMKLVSDLNLQNHVKFHNRFLQRREIIRYLQATDLYITPYLDRNQVSSGTLAYAMAAGKAIISTPYLHAKEALADGRGLFCKFRNPESIADQIRTLINNPTLKETIEKKVYDYSRDSIWTKVAEKHSEVFKQLLMER